ncbi:MAG: phosphoribosylanthranilate isomerase [Oscillospiraceae bacterium]|nr:phosphoribosylanthranilate isomerase [Oscillospiraceae bacterium]
MTEGVKVKICGLWRREDIETINALTTKPDYVGFVFAKSKRQVTPEQAAILREALAEQSPKVIAVGVFVNEPIANITALVKAGAIDMIQLHGSESVENEEYIRELKLHTDKPIIRAALSEAADYLLFDAPIPGAGKVFDWSTIPATKKPFFLAGGLNPDNVAEAITTVKPYAVDVSSGVERGGVKDAALIEAFICAPMNKIDIQK